MPSSTTLTAPNGDVFEYPSTLLTVAQIEEKHPGLKGRVRGIIFRADFNDPDYGGFREAVIRLGRSVYIDEVPFLVALRAHAGHPPARARSPHGRGGNAAKGSR